MAVATGSSASVPMGSFRRTRQATPSAYSPDRPSLHRCERNSPVKNRKRETRASGSVRGEDGNVLTYSAHASIGRPTQHGKPQRWWDVPHQLEIREDQAGPSGVAGGPLYR